MDIADHRSGAPGATAHSRGTTGVSPHLRLVSTGMRLAMPAANVPEAWAAPFARLCDWLGIAPDTAANDACAPQFAPWRMISPVAFQGEGDDDLPDADWAVSYLFDHGPGSAVRAGTLDLALISPHPAKLMSGLPAAALMDDMLEAARAEGRQRIAMIVPAPQRDAMAALACEVVEVLPIEAVLSALACARPRWDALIVMPALRSIVFALLEQGTAHKGPWPMLWHRHDRGLVLAAMENLAQPEGPAPFDAPALVQSLALTLHHGGMTSAAMRLHDAAARLRDSGIVTLSRGSAAPYVNPVADADFLDLLCAGVNPGHRAAPGWLALGPGANAGTSAAPIRLDIIASHQRPTRS